MAMLNNQMVYGNIWRIYGNIFRIYGYMGHLWDQTDQTHIFLDISGFMGTILHNPLWNKHIKHPLLNHGFRGGVISWGIFIGDIHRGYQSSYLGEISNFHTCSLYVGISWENPGDAMEGISLNKYRGSSFVEDKFESNGDSMTGYMTSNWKPVAKSPDRGRVNLNFQFSSLMDNGDPTYEHMTGG